MSPPIFPTRREDEDEADAALVGKWTGTKRLE